MNATPRPWAHGLRFKGVIESAKTCERVATASVDDAELIVSAVNCHDELVAALAKAKAEIEAHWTYDALQKYHPGMDVALDYINAALARAIREL